MASTTHVHDAAPDFEDAPTGAVGDGRVVAAVPDPFQPLWNRGVHPDVVAARGYVPYYGRRHPLHDPEAIDAELARHPLAPDQAATLRRFMWEAREKRGGTYVYGEGDGLLMRKHAIPDADPVLPQLRPRHPVRVEPTWHRHDRDFANRDDLRRHLEKEHPGEDPPPNHRHMHEEWAKYNMPSKAKEEREHDHATDPRFLGPKGRQMLRQHLRKRHDGKATAGTHSHRWPVPGQHVADRIDIHPWALQRLAPAWRVYFAIEGTPKADAILSRIIETGEKSSVFDVPSVTLWPAPELRRFANEHLRYVRDEAGSADSRKLVVIVADADWHHNPRVVRHALLCREFLREKCGVQACVAAPPGPAKAGERGCECSAARARVGDRDACAECGRYFKGVDDFLAAGGELDDLVVINREGSRLALFADDDGRVRSTLWGLVPILGIGRDGGEEKIIEYLQSCADRGLITVHGSLERVEDEFTGLRRWRETPTIEIPPAFRCEQEPVRLGDYEPSQEPVLREVFLEELEVRPDDVAAAIDGAAARTEVSRSTIERLPEARQARADGLLVRRTYAHGWKKLGRRVPEIAAAFGVDLSTIKRDLRTAEPPTAATVESLPVPLALKENKTDVALYAAPIPSDERLAEDAARLITITREVASIAERLATRFPLEPALADAVERFLASLPATN